MNKLKERSLKVVKSVQGKKWHHHLRLNVIGVDEYFHPIQFGINSISFTAMMDKYGSGEQPLPATDVTNTVLASGKEWEVTPFERAECMERMNSHGVVSTFTKMVNAPKVAPKELYKEHPDWRYWFFTHRLGKDREMVDETDASPLFGSGVDGE